MAEITAAAVAKLREMTNAGMMDCKRALTEAAGDLDKAVEILRKTGAASAAKKATREARDGDCQSLYRPGGNPMSNTASVWPGPGLRPTNGTGSSACRTLKIGMIGWQRSPGTK